MKYRITSVHRAMRRLWRDRRGVSALMFAVSGLVFVGVAGGVIDVGRVLAVNANFQAVTQAAALAGAQELSQSGATSAQVIAAATNWHTAHGAAGVTVSSFTATPACVTATANLPNCAMPAAPNVVEVTQTGTVSNFILGAFGKPTFTLTASATASKAGGSSTPLNIMFVLDGTGSMSDAASNCTVPGNGSPTKLDCAMYSVQQVLMVLVPPQDQVGLIIFPPTGSQYKPGTSGACPTFPGSVQYYTTTEFYQIGTPSGATLDTSYSNGSGGLSSSSPLVRAVGNAPTKGCAKNPGGQGSYFAEALTAAQAALPAHVTGGPQNVIIFLSDGDASATQVNGADDFYPAYYATHNSIATKECDQAVTAASAATAAGTWVYSVAYNPPTSACQSGGTYNPCTELQAIASDPTKFFTTVSTCQLGGAPNPVAALPTIFTQIAFTLNKPRLLLN